MLQPVSARYVVEKFVKGIGGMPNGYDKFDKAVHERAVPLLGYAVTPSDIWHVSMSALVVLSGLTAVSSPIAAQACSWRRSGVAGRLVRMHSFQWPLDGRHPYDFPGE
jgi:hypothetical protein